MRPLTRVRSAAKRRSSASLEFKAAILAAHAEGLSLRAIADAASVSHVRVLKIIRGE